MKKGLMILAVVLASVSMYGQNITGKWNGKFYLNGKDLTVVFHISKSKSGLKATMDCPDKKSYGIPVTFTNFNDSILKLEIANAGIEYLGTFDKYNNFVGTINLKNSQKLYPLVLIRKEID
jgi:uncharacterized protein